MCRFIYPGFDLADVLSSHGLNVAAHGQTIMLLEAIQSLFDCKMKHAINFKTEVIKIYVHYYAK